MIQYYIMGDTRRDKLDIAHFSRLRDAVRAYKDLPDGRCKALGIRDGGEAADLILRLPLRSGEPPGEDVLDLNFLEQGGWKSKPGFMAAVHELAVYLMIRYCLLRDCLIPAPEKNVLPRGLREKYLWQYPHRGPQPWGTQRLRQDPYAEIWRHHHLHHRAGNPDLHRHRRKQDLCLRYQRSWNLLHQHDHPVHLRGEPARLPLVRHRRGRGQLNCVICFVFALFFLHRFALLKMAYGAGADCTEFDDRISQINAAMTALLDRKAELVRAGRADTEFDSRVQAITDTLDGTDSAIDGFDNGMVYQTISSIRVLNRERLSIRFKDGTEVEQEIINRRVSA